MANPQGSIVSYVYHKTTDPTYVPLIIDNKLCVLMEHLSRTVIDTKLSALIPWPDTNADTYYVNPMYSQTSPATSQTIPIYTFPGSPLHGIIEQQLNLDKMYANHVLNEQNKVALNANSPLTNTIPVKQQCSAAVQTCFYNDNTTNTYDGVAMDI